MFDLVIETIAKCIDQIQASFFQTIDEYILKQ